MLLAIALFFAFTMTPVYRATVVVTPVYDKGLGNDASMGGLGALASVAGFDIGMNGQNLERSAVLQSRHLVEEFVKDPKVFSQLMARAQATGEKDAGSVWKTVDRFRRTVVDIQPDKLKGTTTVTIDWTDPKVAASWANDFVALANKLMRDRAIEESTRNVEFLNKQLDKTSSVDIQKVMYSLIQQETKTLMLASGRVEYAFRIVDPAVVPEVRVRPWRSLMALTGLVVGLLLGCFVVYIRTRFARTR